MTRRPLARGSRPPVVAPARLTAESAVLGLLFGIVVVAPWTRPGYLLLLDWVSGPHQAIAPALYGLDPAALDALPYRLATHGLRQLIGAGATSWLMVLLYFPVAAGGVSALAGGSRWRRHPAAVFVVCNPFVLQRLQAGHVPFLLSVALLSWLLASAVRARRAGRAFAAAPAGWYALAVAVAPYAAWLGGAALLAVALLPRPRRNDLIRTGVAIVSAAGVYAYALAVLCGAVATIRVGALDLEAYASRAGPGGLVPTLAGLQGFWRGDAGLGGPVGAWALLTVMLVTVVAGLARLGRHNPVLGAPLTVLAVIGLVLGAGVRGPVGPLYRAMIEAVPLFQVMREQQKWVALTMVAYAVAFGVSAEALVGVLRRAGVDGLTAGRRGAGVAAVGGLLAMSAVCAAVAPSLVWGLGATVRLSHYPDDWYAADAAMGPGTEAVLFLPWHQYQPFDFTGSRTVATPASAFFQRPVVSSDAVEMGALRTNSVSRRAAYVERLVAAGGTGHFGRLVAPLGVRYVVLAREREAAQYAWLDRQADLRPVLRTRQLDLYRVDAEGTGRVVAARTGGPDDAFRLAQQGALGNEAVLPGGPTSGALPSASAGGIRRTGSTSWRVEAGPPGWVVIPEEWSPGWSGDGRPSRPTAAGTVAIEVGSAAVTVRYATWRWLRLGLAASLSSLTVLVLAGLLERHRVRTARRLPAGA